MEYKPRKFDDLSKEELAKARKCLTTLVDKLNASSILIYPMNEKDLEFIDKDIYGREYFNPYKK